MEVRDTIRGYILENFLFTDDQSQLEDQTSFMGEGIMDSTGILELIMFIETEFGIEVKEADMTAENFDSVSNMVGFVRRTNGTGA